MENNLKQYALIPAKLYSSRCKNKNWRNFLNNKNLVSYLLSIIPYKLFQSIILSTDKMLDENDTKDIIIHNRDKLLSSKDSPVNDLIMTIINKYKLPDDCYLWLLNPTSPFRLIEDFYKINNILLSERPESMISVYEINPFIWKESDITVEPLFETNGFRKNTQDFENHFFVENGQFYVFSVEMFKRTRSWYSKKSVIYKQKGLRAFIDIDTEEDFIEAQKWGETINDSIYFKK